MSVINYAQAYQYIINVGGTPEEADLLARLASPESSYNTQAHNQNAQTGDNSYGLWQINMLGQMGVNRQKQYGLSSYDELFTPEINAMIALDLLHSQGTAAWTNSSKKLGIQITNSGVPSGYQAQGAPGGASASPGPTGSQAPATQYKIPAGGMIVTIGGGYKMVVYQVGQADANGHYTTLYFGVGNDVDTSGTPAIDITSETWNQWLPFMVDGGSAASLDSVAKNYGSFAEYFKWILDTHLGPNEEAKNDAGVIKVMALLAARPDMSAEELQNLLKETDYWKSKTEAQLAWNDFSPAEQAKRIEEMTVQLQDQFFQLVGTQPTADQQQALQWWAQQVASGQKGLNEAISVFVKTEALKNPESPWSRTIRSEQENQLQRGVDIENKTAAATQLAAQWGVQIAPDTAAQWGSDLVSNQKSEADLLEFVRGQAQILYPWLQQLDPTGTIATQDLATPWLQTYSRVMEKPGELLNADVQKALQNGTPVWQFEKDLKSQPSWLETKNAQDSFTQAASDLGTKLGFG